MKLRYREGYLFQTAEDYTCETGIARGVGVGNKFIFLSATGQLTVKEGYAWDGASKPAINRKANKRASLEHDALYQLGREGLLPKEFRKHADERFRIVCKEAGMWHWLADADYYALRAFAGFAWNPRDNETLEAP